MKTPRTRKGAQRVSRRTLREGIGKSQVEIAEALGIDQGEVSRIERRRDIRLPTLRRYVEALGGALEVAAVFPDGARVLLADPEDEDPPK